MNIEVFSFDGNKTFDYEITTDIYSISKMNKKITLIDHERKSCITISKDFKILTINYSANFFKQLHNVFFSHKYTNKATAKKDFLKLIFHVDKFFENESFIEHFSEYNLKNNSILDTIEDSGSTSELIVNKEYIDKKLNLFIVPIFEKELQVLSEQTLKKHQG